MKTTDKGCLRKGSVKEYYLLRVSEPPFGGQGGLGKKNGARIEIQPRF
jgi:hypothetical protein